MRPIVLFCLSQLISEEGNLFFHQYFVMYFYQITLGIDVERCWGAFQSNYLIYALCVSPVAKMTTIATTTTGKQCPKKSWVQNVSGESAKNMNHTLNIVRVNCFVADFWLNDKWSGNSFHLPWPCHGAAWRKINRNDMTHDLNIMVYLNCAMKCIFSNISNVKTLRVCLKLTLLACGLLIQKAAG